MPEIVGFLISLCLYIAAGYYAHPPYMGHPSPRGDTTSREEGVGPYPPNPAMMPYGYYYCPYPGGESWPYPPHGYDMEKYGMPEEGYPSERMPIGYYNGMYGYPPRGPYDPMMYPAGPHAGYPFRPPYPPDEYSTRGGMPPGYGPMVGYGGYYGRPTSDKDSSSESSTSSSEAAAVKATPAKKQRRLCLVEGCTKFAQGVTRCCTKHGGGKRCTYPGCTKGAVGSTQNCVAHGGGKRCKAKDCTKSAIPMYDFCFAHGGGKRCAYTGCTKGARATTLYCIGHGGGKRCKIKNCSKSDQGAGLCIAHGGGRRKRKAKGS